MLLGCIPQPGTAFSKTHLSPVEMGSMGLFSRLFRRQLGFVALHKLDQAETQYTADVSELDKVKPAQASLNVTSEGLWPTQHLCELVLGQT